MAGLKEDLGKRSATDGSTNVYEITKVVELLIFSLSGVNWKNILVEIM